MKTPPSPYVLITGGAGFIGTNLAARLAGQEKTVLIYDNLARQGVEKNLNWLLGAFPGRVQFWHGDVRDAESLKQAVSGAEAVFHLAAQVAVTTSLTDPLSDFEVNARGTLNLLEALRAQANPPPLLFTSTNKVFGDLESIALSERATRYEPENEVIRENGIGEEWQIQFRSPYGCSKGAADQYVLDYARSFGLPAVVFRMSCIYGPHQYGNEDQGWVAHFVRRAIAKTPITFYGDGKQVRDALFVEDLMDAFLAAITNIEKTRGQAFNIGGGPQNTTSLIELIDLLGELNRSRPQIVYDDWRTSDQRYYVSNVHAFAQSTGWAPRVPLNEGVSRLHNWVLES